MKINQLEIGKIYKSTFLKYQLIPNKKYAQLFYLHPLFGNWWRCKLSYNEVVTMNFEEV